MIEGLEEHWVQMLIVFMKDKLGFIVSNKVSDTWILPEGGG